MNEQPVFLDTNILVYIYDGYEPDKRRRAITFLSEELKEQKTVISSQVINEFCNVMTTKKGTLMTIDDLHRVLQEVLGPMLAHLPSVESYRRAVTLRSKLALSFYDALIVQAALDLNCSVLYSEDLQDGQTFGKLKIVNPFKQEA